MITDNESLTIGNILEPDFMDDFEACVKVTEFMLLECITALLIEKPD